MSLTSTHTYATLKIDAVAFDHIKERLQAAGPEYVERYLDRPDLLHWGGEVALQREGLAQSMLKHGVADRTMWIVGKAETGREGVWHFQGLYDTEEQARAACRESCDFIAPAVPGAEVTQDKVAWEGLIWPLIGNL